MKKLTLLLLLLLLIGCKTKTVVHVPEEVVPKKLEIEKLAISDVNENLKAKAYELGKRVLMTCNTSKFKPFNESEATATVIKNTTLEHLSKTCARFRQHYGTFKDIELIEIYRDPSQNYTIFRYKALYSKKIANKELRVFMNDENKVAAIKSLDWVDNFESNTDKKHL
jgi:hypothetical protein